MALGPDGEKLMLDLYGLNFKRSLDEDDESYKARCKELFESLPEPKRTEATKTASGWIEMTAKAERDREQMMRKELWRAVVLSC